MEPSWTVLIADDEPLKVLTLKEHLELAGYRVLSAADGEAALAVLKSRRVDALVTDVRMPGLDGLRLLEASKKLDPSRPVLVITGYEEVKDAVRAMKAGAFDYLVKPVSGEEIALRVGRAMQGAALIGENLRLRHEVQRLRGRSDPVIVGEGMKPLLRDLEKVAPTDATVLLQGETGTGKEVCARHLHRHSPRAQAPFVVLPCAALSASLAESEIFGHEKGAFTGAVARRDGYFSSAHGGTILLDDVDDLPLDIQGKLLHILETQSFQRVGSPRIEKVNVRIVATTKKDLSKLAGEQRFRDDLLYRLSVVSISLPPLRERRQDIGPLSRFFLECALARLGRGPKKLTEDALRQLMRHDWPGNVRELEHVIETAVIMHSGPEIKPGDLPPLRHVHRSFQLFTLHIQGEEAVPLDDAVLDFERALLKWAFQKAEQKQSRAAQLLGVPRSTFQYRWSRAFDRVADPPA